jgi:hypothetical protein
VGAGGGGGAATTAGEETTAGKAAELVALGAGSTGAGDEAAADAVDAVSGTAGPIRTPARRGHATPTMNPIAVITPTFVHEGRSCDAVGTCTTSEGSALRVNIGTTRYHSSASVVENAATIARRRC